MVRPYLQQKIENEELLKKEIQEKKSDIDCISPTVHI